MRLFLRKFWALAGPYWSSADKWRALLLLAVIMGMNLGMVYIQVELNQWVREFYNALQAIDRKMFLHQLMIFALLAFSYIAQAVYMLYLSQMLEIRWRQWLTRVYLEEWLRHQGYYRMQFLAHPVDNPDQRISEDISSFINLTLNLGIMLLSSAATFISFVAILWQLSGSLTVPLGSLGQITIPGYMVWGAIAYSILGTYLTIRVGSPLIGLNFNQQRYEADFRFSMVRLRENSEGIAIYGGERQEQEGFLRRFTAVVNNFRAIMRRQKRLSWLTNSYSQLAVIFPVLLAAPRYFAGQMHLGGLMQTAGAFGAVHGALSYLVTSYTTIATWRAVLDRLTGFNSSIEHLALQQANPGVDRVRWKDAILVVDSLSVFLPGERVLVDSLDLCIAPGAALLITGEPGAGKSTLLRALAGIWPFCRGTVFDPQEAQFIFVPQKPYLPLGTLRQALYYPDAPVEGDPELAEILKLCGLSAMEENLDKDADWAHALSPGEQQRVAFARILLQRPDFLFLDESTASLDEKTEKNLYLTLRQRLPGVTMVSVGHRSTLLELHTSILHLEGDGRWELVEQRSKAMPGVSRS